MKPKTRLQVRLFFWGEGWAVQLYGPRDATTLVLCTMDEGTRMDVTTNVNATDMDTNDTLTLHLIYVLLLQFNHETNHQSAGPENIPTIIGIASSVAPLRVFRPLPRPVGPGACATPEYRQSVESSICRNASSNHDGNEKPPCYVPMEATVSADRASGLRRLVGM